MSKEYVPADRNLHNTASINSEHDAACTSPILDTDRVRTRGILRLRKKSVSDKNDSKNKDLVHRFRIAKQIKSIKNAETAAALEDAQISIDQFAESARALDKVCYLVQPVKNKHDPPSPLGLVPFMALQDSSSQAQNIQNNGQSLHLSLEEDIEEDMFSDIKEEDTDMEFSSWNYKSSESSTSFSGFSIKESTYSTNVATRYSKRRKWEGNIAQEETFFRGFTSTEIHESASMARKSFLKNYSLNSDFGNRPAMEVLDKSATISTDKTKMKKDENRNDCKVGNPPGFESQLKFSKPQGAYGFATAGGRPISISKKALEKAKTMFTDEIVSSEQKAVNQEVDNIPELGSQSKSSYSSGGCGFATAGGRPIKISETALERAKRIFSDEIESIDEDRDDWQVDNIPEVQSQSKSSNPPGGSGFATAGGRPIKISETALERAKRIFSDEIESIDQDRDDWEADNISAVQSQSKSSNPPGSSGFATAGGRPIKISETALERAKRIFSDEIESIDKDKEDWQVDDFSDSEILPKFAPNEVRSFSTAGGRTIDVSVTTMAKAQRLYKEVECAEFRKNEVIENPQELAGYVSSGFSTAGGRELKISQDALSKANTQFEEIQDLCIENSNEEDSKFDSRNSEVSSLAKETATTSVQKNCTADLEDMEPLDIADFADPIEESEPSKKRKFEDIDDDTPQRRDPPWKRKKGRYVSELPGRKLFDSNQEDKPVKEFKIVGSSDDDMTISAFGPQKILISDEIDASAAAFLEDEELSQKAEIENRHLSKQLRMNSTSEQIEISDNGGRTSKEKEKEISKTEIQHESIPEDLTFDSQFSQEFHHSQVLNKFIMETMKIMEARLAMSSKQDEAIRAKRRTKPQALDGSLYKLRTSNRDLRISWRDLTDGSAPIPREISKESMGSDVLSVTASSAESYSFCCADFYGGRNVRINVEGIEVGDGAFLILNEKNCAGAREFERAFLASPGVDPNLVPTGWVRNHYRWIVWKLASMDRVKFQHKCLPRMLTPNRVMLELKYRYDREIYRSQWPPLRRILEKNEDPCARIVLCVASITAEEDDKTPVKGSSTPSSFVPTFKIKLTDGWYSIAATIDCAMVNCIKSGKVKEGTKLVTFGAKPINLDQGCSALEIPDSVTLRIHTNSTRRVRWYTKLDYCFSNRGPMCLNLKSVKPNGGAICKMMVAVARLYPILYREKLPDGQFVFRNERSDEEAARAHEARYQSKIEEIYANASIEFQNCSQSGAQEEEIRQSIASKLSECLPPPRDVTPVMKIRIAEGEISAMMTIWSTDRETAQIFVEGSSISVHNAFASGQRSNELQITANRNTFFEDGGSRRIVYPKRIFTSLMEISVPDFSPIYGEFDTVGIVSSVGPAPHGMKNFETVNLACPRPEDDETSDFLSVLFWQGVSTHGYSKILTPGTLVACSNLEWRRNTSRSIPTAYCTERSVFTKNPRRNHLTKPFESLQERVKDSFAYAASSAEIIQAEIAKKSALRTPGSGTSYRAGTSSNNTTPGWSPRDQGASNESNCTPTHNSRKSSMLKRIEKLEAYGEAPKLPAIVINNSSQKVLSDFRSPILKPIKKS